MSHNAARAVEAKLVLQKIKKCFSGLSEEKREEIGLRVYAALDEWGIENGRHLVTPGLDPVIALDEPVTISMTNSPHEIFFTTIREMIEVFATLGAVAFATLPKVEIDGDQR